jgi:hypothetical protein
MNRSLPFAFLASRLSAAREDIRHAYPDATFDRENAGHFGDGRRFIIVTVSCQMKGLQLSGFETLPSAMGGFSPLKLEMFEAHARARVFTQPTS